MIYVYLLRSCSDVSKTYVGLTTNLKKRLLTHNQGRARHTSKFRPWSLETYIAFSSLEKAVDFERYLKSGSGRAFMKKRL